MTGTGLSLGNHTSFFFDRNLKTSPAVESEVISRVDVLELMIGESVAATEEDSRQTNDESEDQVVPQRDLARPDRLTQPLEETLHSK